MWRIIENHISYLLVIKIIDFNDDFIVEKMQQQKSMHVTLMHRKVVIMLAVRYLRRKTFKRGSLHISLNRIFISYFYHTLSDFFRPDTWSVAKNKLMDSKKN